MEKFLRRNSFSSDCSTPIECSTPITTKARNKTKSLESLTDKKDRESVRNLSENSKSHVKKEGDKLEVKKAEKSMESAKVIVKHTGEKLDKKKSQFNYESIIEITLPSAPTLPPNPPQVLDKSQNEEEPIKPILCTPAKPKIPSHNNANMSPSSVHESCVSNKQNPLEWDSFLPVSCLFSSVAINSY